ncbi:MAG: precorrin-6y C5,15-methyltransferase (decarboxylating) subunit CbiE [Gammaproteobacteria bacterium]|jgi:precorrin-6Y C5,15-methyltransferase (decarboxylating)|nr:precorrin-6y C5,15-methyltransferase (decarboxylating) subunit CbiE [Gammaproteobacteria bacterium]
MLNISVIGLGIHQPPVLTTTAQQALGQAQAVFGSARQLASVAHLLATDCEPCELPKLTQLAQQLQPYQQVVILASGDPLLFGIGKFLQQEFPQQVTCYSGISSLQGACQLTGLSLQDAQLVSLHGRPLNSLRRHLQPNRQLLVLTDQHSQPQHLAQQLADVNLGASRLHVCERLGYADQRYRQFSVQQLLAHDLTFDALHVSVIETRGPGGIIPNFPGIPDHEFITDGVSVTGRGAGHGLLTKREVRLAILSLLQAGPDQIGWDIGAGCGGVAVEWALWNPKGQVYAIEHHQQRFDCLQANRDKFGVGQNLYAVQQTAPQGLSDLPSPDKVFVGGSSGALNAIMLAAWQALRPGGRLLASAVTEQSKATLLQFGNQVGCDIAELLQVSVSRADKLAGHDLLRPNLPITLICWDKPHE